MEKRGLTAYLVVTETFRSMVLAQAKARNAAPRLIVVPHPIGGLNDAELAERMDQATVLFLEAINRDA